MMSEFCSKPDKELFTYTSGRYLYNEKLRLAERHVHFDVPALKDIATDCVGRRSVTRMEKLAEGGFSRVFLLTMDDGFEVIAKLPYSLTVPKHWTFCLPRGFLFLESTPGLQKVAMRLDQNISLWKRLRDSHWNHGGLV